MGTDFFFGLRRVRCGGIIFGRSVTVLELFFPWTRTENIVKVCTVYIPFK